MKVTQRLLDIFLFHINEGYLSLKRIDHGGLGALILAVIEYI